MATSAERIQPQRTILVTGASGFIGQRLIARLAESPSTEVRALVRRRPAKAAADVHWIQGDLQSPTTYLSHLAGVDLVIHLAAAVGRCPSSQYLATNCQGTEELLKLCRAAGVGRFLFVSTIAVRFSGLNRYPYAESKRQAELLVRRGGIPYQIVRPTIVLGHDGPNWQSLVKLAKLPITPIFGRGTNLIQPIDVDDLVNCLIELAAHPIEEEVIELGGPDVVTMNEFFRRVHCQNSTRRFRAWHLPLGAIRAGVGGLERIAGHRLPLTLGQLSVFGNDSTIMPSRFHRSQRESMRSLQETIVRASTAVDDDAGGFAKQHQECVTFSQYLVGRPPAANVQQGYARAHEQGVIADATASPGDLRMVALARRHAWLCHGSDSYSRFFAPQSLLRRKLVLLLALWECEAESRDNLQLERPVPAFWIGVRIATRLIACGILALVAAGVLLPLKLLKSPRPSRGAQGD